MGQGQDSEIPTGFKLAVGGVAALFLLIALFTSWVTIPAGSRGVVMHWGKVQTEVLDEGLYFTCPFMTSVKKMSVRVNKSEIQATGASKDTQKVDSVLAINWHLDSKDVQSTYQSIGSEDVVIENVLTPAVNEVFKAAAAQLSAEEIISKRIELKENVDSSLIERLKKYNIIIDDISIVNIEFSKEFNDAIEQKQVAEQNAKKAVYVAQQAKAEAQAKVNEAQGQAESQKLVLSSLTNKILLQKAIDKWDGHFPEVMGTNSALPLLDLKSLKSNDKSGDDN